MARRKTWQGLCVAAGWAIAQAAAAAPPSTEELLRASDHTLASISPDGRHLAVTKRLGDRVVLAIVERETMKVVKALDPQESGAVERVSWMSPTRLLLRSSRRGKSVNQSFLENALVAVNIDGTRLRTFHGDVFDTLVDDDDTMLARYCGKTTAKGCWTYVRRVNGDGVAVGGRLAEAPMINAAFMADNAGTVRFAYGWDDASMQRLWLMRDGAWQIVNDESDSGVEVLPMGVSRDGLSGFLLSERASGPDVIERIAFSDGLREQLLADDALDPLYLLWSADGAQPVGAAYGVGVPRARFWDPADPDAVLIRQLEAAYPEDAVVLSSGSRDGAHVVVGVAADRDPGSYYLLDRASKKSALLARSKDWLSLDTLATSQPVEITARDGVVLHGYLTVPLQRDGDAPLVVLVHGGPFGVRDGWSYDEEVQLLAARGYAVLRVNFRGSAGRGRAFIESGYREWGGRMQDDVTDATRWAIAQPGIDGDRTCIWGTSYGGYAALMGAVREPALYRCVVAAAAVTDLNISWRWGDIQRSAWGRHYLETAVGRPGRALGEISPVQHAAAIRAEVLLVHGRRDQRVSYEHAKAMLAAFERAGKPVEHEFFVNETHGIYGDENRAAYYRRVFAFLDRHAGGAGEAAAASTASRPASEDAASASMPGG